MSMEAVALSEQCGKTQPCRAADRDRRADDPRWRISAL